MQKDARHEQRTLALGKAAAELVSDVRHEEESRAQRVRAEGGKQRIGEALDLRQSFLAGGDYVHIVLIAIPQQCLQYSVLNS